MNRAETLKILSVLRATFPQFYRGLGKNELDNIVSIWNEMFLDDPYEIVGAAVKTLIASDSSGYPPVIGKVKEKIRLLTMTETMTEAEAWSKVYKALQNGSYGSVEEFNKLPPVLQRCVGSPAQLKEWAAMDMDEIQSVVASNLQRSYRAFAKREEEVRSIPKDVLALAVGLSGHLALETADE